MLYQLDVKPEWGWDLLTSLNWIEDELTSFIEKHRDANTVICLERQLSVGGQSSSLMFSVQMSVLRALQDMRLTDKVVMPLPTQLKSYIKKVHGVDPKSKSVIVSRMKELTGIQGRVSSHKADAYFLARAARDVMLGRWQYKIPSKEIQLFPGEILNG